MQSHITVKGRLENLGVACVYLFGSRAQSLDQPHSDFDIGILLFHPSQLKNSAGLYQELYEIFSDFFQTMANIDIVFLQESTGQLCYHVVKEGQVLFDIDPRLRRRFEDQTILEHADFEPHRRLFEKHLLESIP